MNIFKLPFMKGFNILSTLSFKDQDTVFKSIVQGPLDLDKAEFCMTPTFFHKEFSSDSASVVLATHKPQPRKLNEDDPGYEFKDWLLIAKGSSQLFINPHRKKKFFQELEAMWRSVDVSEADLVGTYGSLHVPVEQFVHCLKQAGCWTIRSKSYGQKKLLCPPFHYGDMSQPSHSKAHLNEWDIGRTHSSPWITLFKPTLGMGDCMTLFPMVVPASGDFGSVHGRIKYQGSTYKVKIYPRIVHVIKSINSRIQGETLKTIAGLKKRTDSCINMVQRLSKKRPEQLGGFRIEVTVQAPTLIIAKQIVENTPLLNLKYYTTPSGDATEGHMLDVMVTDKEHLLQNASWVIERARSLQPAGRRDETRPLPLQKQMVADIMCSFGWNAGRLRPTPSRSAGAWWLGPVDNVSDPNRIFTDEDPVEVGVGKVIAHLNKRYPTNAAAKKLLEKMRGGHPDGYLACPTGQQGHQWIIHNSKESFSMRCNRHRLCKPYMNHGAAFRFFAKLLLDGTVPLRTVGLSDNEITIIPTRVSCYACLTYSHI